MNLKPLFFWETGWYLSRRLIIRGLKADSKPLTLRQLCAEPMIVRETDSGNREVIDRAFARRGQKLQRPPLVLGSTEAIKARLPRVRGGNRVTFNLSNGAGSGPIRYPAPAGLPADQAVAQALLAQPGREISVFRNAKLADQVSAEREGIGATENTGIPF